MSFCVDVLLCWGAFELEDFLSWGTFELMTSGFVGLL